MYETLDSNFYEKLENSQKTVFSSLRKMKLLFLSPTTKKSFLVLPGLAEVSNPLKSHVGCEKTSRMYSAKNRKNKIRELAKMYFRQLLSNH